MVADGTLTYRCRTEMLVCSQPPLSSSHSRTGRCDTRVSCDTIADTPLLSPHSTRLRLPRLRPATSTTRRNRINRLPPNRPHTNPTTPHRPRKDVHRPAPHPIPLRRHPRRRHRAHTQLLPLPSRVCCVTSHPLHVSFGAVKDGDD